MRGGKSNFARVLKFFTRENLLCGDEESRQAKYKQDLETRRANVCLVILQGKTSDEETELLFDVE